VSEFRAILITVLAGSAGMLVGAVTASVVGVGTGDVDLIFGVVVPSGVSSLFVAVGFALGPWLALRAAGLHLAEVTTALAVVWMLLLIMAVGPILDVIGPSWFPLMVALASLAIARTIAGPFAPYLAAVGAEPDVAEPARL
jgi:hypothetical protein